MIVKDCLGRERTPEHVWPDGSYSCPFCFGAVMGDWNGCHNPACAARVDEKGALDFPPEVAQKSLVEQEKRAAEVRERAEIEEFRCQYAAERAAETFAQRKAATEECERRGTCLRCLFQRSDGKPKYIKHRGPCPNAPRARV